MMRVLFDTSALYKRYDAEPGHDRVMAISDDADDIVVAPHCKIEIASALNRQRHDGKLTLADYTRILAVVQRDFGGFTCQALGPPVEMLALAAMESARLRAMDALHIATAQHAQVDLFVTADRRQASVARAVGLTTELLGEKDAP